MNIYNLCGDVLIISPETLKAMCVGDNLAVSVWQLETHIERTVVYQNAEFTLVARVCQAGRRLTGSLTLANLVNVSEPVHYVLVEVGIVHSTASAFCAVRRSDGCLVTWGNPYHGGDSSTVHKQLDGDVDAIYSNNTAFCAVRKSDGGIVTWGSPLGGGDSSTVREKLRGDVAAIYGTEAAFCALTKSGREIVTWGDPFFGGDSSAVQTELRGGVSAVFTTDYAFCAVKRSNGGIVAWGCRSYGGDCSQVAQDLVGDVATIYSTAHAFCAVKQSDAAIVQWGYPLFHERSSGDWRRLEVWETVQGKLRGGVSAMYTTANAFCAVTASEGSIVTWGEMSVGGDSSAVEEQLRGDVATIYSNDHVFCAVRESDSAIVTWGHRSSGGDSAAVQAELRGDVRAICSTENAFCALTKFDGAIVMWGEGQNDRVKGIAGYSDDDIATRQSLRADVAAMYSNDHAFCAVRRSDGGIVTWGHSRNGGDSSVVTERLLGNVAPGMTAPGRGWRKNIGIESGEVVK
jgi:hypothetical protein